ncbi:TIGR01777 family oxidoreductase [Verrucomicrobiota bacterium sgz303538]
MNIGLTGATGFIGRKIVDLALRRGHEIIAFSRSPERGIPGCEMRRFSLEEAPDISGCDALIHLAGESVVGLWTASKKERIRSSRVLGTRRVVEAINSSANPPEVFVCGSAIGFYGDSGDTELTENASAGDNFLAETVQLWEAEATKTRSDTRVVLLRTGVVLGKEGGAIPAMTPAFRAGLGGPIGNGRQYMSWIHLEDEAMLALFALENLDIRGPLNATAPWPVRNEEFAQLLAKTLRRPAFFRAPAFAIRMLGEFSHELLDSKRVVPAVATEHGFRFRFPELEPALKDLLG